MTLGLYNEIAFAPLAALSLWAAGALRRELRWLPPAILTAAVALRIVRVLRRYEVLFRIAACETPSFREGVRLPETSGRSKPNSCRRASGRRVASGGARTSSRGCQGWCSPLSVPRCAASSWSSPCSRLSAWWEAVIFLAIGLATLRSQLAALLPGAQLEQPLAALRSPFGG